MLRIAAVVLSLALSVLALAQTSDLKVTMEHPDSVRLGDIATLTITVENAGTATAQNTRVSFRIIPGRQCDESIVLGDLAPGEKRTVTCTQEVLDFGLYYMEFSAGAGSTPDEPDALRADNFVNAFAPRLTVGTIDGTTQAGYFGDTNPDGPEIEIDGSATAGDGLRLPGRCGITVAGLALNGFRGSAVLVYDAPQACLVDGGPATVQDNYIGTDPTGTQAKPNERGVFSLSLHGVSVFRNVISGNTRSAVYMARGRGLIANNIIGLNHRHDAPLPNGDGTDVNDNYIGFNAHFGVAIDRGAELVALQGNSFQANGGLAIDWGLDGPEAGGSTRTPSIHAVRYANGVTTIEVDAQPSSTFPVVSFYASDAPDPSGFGEGQYFLGTAHPPFRLEVPLDLRGKWISATLTDVNTLQLVRGNDNSNVWRTTTSEMSRAVAVR
jgi:hypothetical protein